MFLTYEILSTLPARFDDKEMFQRTITHKDKESDFLRWYTTAAT